MEESPISLEPGEVHHYKYELLADVHLAADGTYHYYFDTKEFPRTNLQFILDRGTGDIKVTIFGTVQDDCPVYECMYQDITLRTFGVTSITESDILIDDAEVFSYFKYIMIQVVANTRKEHSASWQIYYKGLPGKCPLKSDVLDSAKAKLEAIKKVREKYAGLSVSHPHLARWIPAIHKILEGE